ncbi:MAG TPA: CDP-diacylglycerol--glycerol-3-phosphate 3-phosphatidyltransferase [Microbacteriaceae bacterium]|nr:CDP-diacylglycerol--glycerol-3-phosphate 3-phosphatidyltransferase [Microbacteriaceae bacterium]
MAESRNLLTRNPLRGRFVRDGDPATEPASILCLPNVISLVRIAFIPVMVWALLTERFDPAHDWPFGWGTSWAHWLGAGLFVVGIASDAIDGHIARRRRLVTDFGIFLDPIADKGLTGAALLCMAIMWPPAAFWWPVVILILIREWGITWWRAVALKDRVIPAGSLGKWKTAAQGVVISILLLFPLALSQLMWIAWALMLVVLALTLWSGIDYLVKAYRRTPGG